MSDCMIAYQALYGPADACSSASHRVLELSEDYNLARNNVSFSEADNVFTMMCTLPGCRERLINFIMSCYDPVSHFKVRYYSSTATC